MRDIDLSLEITRSLPFVQQSLAKAIQELKLHPTADRVHVLTTLVKILATKQVARVLLKPQTEAFGLKALQSALELEIELAKYADARGMGL